MYYFSFRVPRVKLKNFTLILVIWSMSYTYFSQYFLFFRRKYFNKRVIPLESEFFIRISRNDSITVDNDIPMILFNNEIR